MQYSIFDFLYPDFKINKPLRLIELFAGYGSQALALKYLGKEFEHHRICEWAVKSISAYNDMHIKDYTDYSVNYTIEWLRDYLFNKGISANYNEPMNRKAIDRLSEKQVRTIYNNIVATHNLVNIQQVHSDDLDISGDYIYMMTYSFPCQDLSLAGKTAGMSKGTGTRSGMLWEVERILKECKQLPQILLMENVPQVHSVDNTPDFNEWQFFLESLGYKNYWQDLSATDYGIPQTRNRCFMVSLLGDFNYTFPQPETLKIRLKDLLEPVVDEKYFLSDKMIQCFMSDGTGRYPRRERFLQNLNGDKEIGRSVTTLAGNRPTDNFVLEYGNRRLNETLEDNKVEDKDFIDCYNKKVKKDVAGTITTRVSESNNTFVAVIGNYSPSKHNASRVVDPNGIAPTVMENHGTVTAIPIKNNTKKGYLLAEEGDGIDISSRMQYHRGTVQKGLAQTITTAGGNDRGVVLKRELCNSLVENSLVEEGDIVKHSYTRQIMNGDKKCVEKNDGTMITLTTRGDTVGIVVKDTPNYIEWKEKGKLDIDCRAWKENAIAPTTTTPKSKVLLNNLRIRKLTPRECFRLMGVHDDDFDSVAKNQSNASLYHLAGDSIVVNVLMAIFKNLF